MAMFRGSGAQGLRGCLAPGAAADLGTQEASRQQGPEAAVQLAPSSPAGELQWVPGQSPARHEVDTQGTATCQLRVPAHS